MGGRGGEGSSFAELNGGDSGILKAAGTEWWRVVPRKMSQSSANPMSQVHDDGRQRISRAASDSGGSDNGKTASGSDEGSGRTDGSVSSTQATSLQGTQAAWDQQGYVNPLAALMSGPLWCRRNANTSSSSSAASQSGSSLEPTLSPKLRRAHESRLKKITSSENCAMLMLNSMQAQALAEATSPYYQ